MEHATPRLRSLRPFSRLLIVMIVGIPLFAGAIGLSDILSGNEATAQPTTRTGDYFLRIDGIPGESDDAAHKDEIELLSYEWSNDGEPGLEQSTTGGGKVQANTIYFTENVSKASPLLMVAAANAKQFREATLFVRKSGETPLQYITIKLTDVLVSSYRTTTTPAGTPTDEFALSFGGVQYSYTPQNADGTSASPVVGTWDFRTNRGG